jgi:hypothetical protein
VKLRLFQTTPSLLAACILGGLAPATSLAATEESVEEPAESPVTGSDDEAKTNDGDDREKVEATENSPPLVEPDLLPSNDKDAPAEFVVSDSLTATPEGKALHAVWNVAGHRFTPEVRAAFITYSKSQARADLTAAKESLPADFLAWVDSDPVVEASVYGIKSRPANVLRILRSLDLDLGSDVVRKEYTQLALAMAVTNADKKDFAKLGVNLTDRPVMKLVIPPNPLKPVNTNGPNRKLDENDHIINFLNSKPFEYEVKIKPAQKGDPVTVEKRTRPMTGGDVIQSKELQADFNAYMKAKGQSVRVDCPRPNPAEMGKMGPVINASEMFRVAYEAKGLLAQRDPSPTLAESCAFLIRNDRHTFAPELNRKWPLFPLKSPWPALMLLADDRDPLRECQEIWENYRDTGKGNKKGPAYVGPIAQKPPLLRARSIAPLEFGYGSVQMMCKDGGVCGVQSGVAVRTQQALGLPAATTRETGHCGTTGVRIDPATNTFTFGNGQSPTTWPFSNPASPSTSPRRAATTGFGVNLGMPALLDSIMAHRVLSLLPPDERKAHGLELIKSGLEINPYNILLTEAIADLDVVTQLRMFKWIGEKQAALNKPGCPIFLRHTNDIFAKTLLTQPVPADKEACREIYAYMMENKLGKVASIARYRAAAEGISGVLAEAEESFKAHLAKPRSVKGCQANVGILNAAAMEIKDPATRATWAKARLAEMEGLENYLVGGVRLTLDPAVPFLSKMAGVKVPPAPVLFQSFLTGLTKRVEADVTAVKPSGAVTRGLLREVLTTLTLIKDPVQKKQWREHLVKLAGDRPSHQAFKQGILKNDWKVLAFSRQSKSRSGFAELAIDGAPYTCWHTTYGPQDQGGFPQEISIDMGELKNLRGFTYQPRSSQASGMVDDCAFHTSPDGKTWTLAAEGKFDLAPMKARKVEQRVEFAPTLARYFKFVAKHALKDNYAAVAEVGVIEAQ